MKTFWLSPGKINLFLYITGQRTDGYHTLQTLFQFLNYGDIITIETRNDEQICLLTPLQGITYENNLIILATRLLLSAALRMSRLSKSKGINISINKHLPIGGGLGGGSSNAATMLIALNQLWNCGFSELELSNLGLRLGADVPAFIYGHSAFAEGIGERLYPVSPPEKWYLITYPGVSVSTKLIFSHSELPRNRPTRSLKTLLECEFSNDCEIITRKLFREVDLAISWLLNYAPSRLTGTGSCILSEFDTESDARQVLKQIPKWLHSFVVQGINCSPLKKGC